MDKKLEIVLDNISSIVGETNLLIQGVKEKDFLANADYIALGIREKLKQVVVLMMCLYKEFPDIWNRFSKWGNYMTAADKVAEHNIGSELKASERAKNKFIYMMAWKLATKSLPQLKVDIKSIYIN